jgi:transcriptional regulator with XRE-family HTH domain
MPRNEATPQAMLIVAVKEQSGRQIERARKFGGITQRQLARDLGMGTRWLREIESGNPAARLEDHLKCTQQLGLSVGHILIPLLFHGHDMDFPQQLAMGDLHELERQCIDLIAKRKIQEVTSALTPRWWRPGGPTTAGSH